MPTITSVTIEISQSLTTLILTHTHTHTLTSDDLKEAITTITTNRKNSLKEHGDDNQNTDEQSKYCRPIVFNSRFIRVRDLINSSVFSIFMLRWVYFDFGVVAFFHLQNRLPYPIPILHTSLHK